MEKKQFHANVDFGIHKNLDKPLFGADTQHQPENGYENATDEEKTKMMLQIAKEANAEQKAMFERTCLCKDKGVIELIEEAVEVERKRIQEGIEWLPKYPLHGEQAVMLSEAIQVINKEEIPRNPLDQNKWM